MATVTKCMLKMRSMLKRDHEKEYTTAAWQRSNILHHLTVFTTNCNNTYISGIYLMNDQLLKKHNSPWTKTDECVITYYQ